MLSSRLTTHKAQLNGSGPGRHALNFRASASLERVKMVEAVRLVGWIVVSGAKGSCTSTNAELLQAGRLEKTESRQNRRLRLQDLRH